MMDAPRPLPAASLQALESRLAIQELLGRYCFCIDERDWTQLRELFTEDGEWVTAYARARGREEIVHLLDRLVPPPGEGPKRTHFVSNIVVVPDGDSATSKSNYVIYRESDTGIVASVVGTYHDDLRKVDGEWKFRKRDIVHRMTGDMGLRKPS
jgi:uncharacterized protein (TIGR02246 family)